MFISRWNGARVAFATALLLGLASIASASITLNLTTVGSSGTINGALYQQIDPQSTGTGTIDSFAQIGGNTDQTQGYNTTENGTLDNGSPDNFNHSITLGIVPIVSIGGIDYRQFLLDVNENSGGTVFNDRFISLDEVQLFVGGTANSNVETFNGSGVLNHNGTLVYRMDGPGTDNNWVALDFQLNSGSGSGDMFLNVPVSLFAGFSNSDVVTLYSEFGQQGEVSAPNAAGVPQGNYGNSDGFEEWAVREATGVIPEPTAFLVWALLIGCACFRTTRQRPTGGC